MNDATPGQSSSEAGPPSAALRAAALIDRINGALGRASAWLVLVMVLIGAFNAVARYAGRFIGVNLSANVYLELQWYLFSLVFLLGGAYALREDAHVRVDVVFSNVSDRARAWINLIGTVALLLPFCLFSLWVAVPVVANSWRIREGSPDPGGLPRYPLKTVIIICFALLVLQGVSEFIKELHKLRAGGGTHPDHHEQPQEGV